MVGGIDPGWNWMRFRAKSSVQTSIRRDVRACGGMAGDLWMCGVQREVLHIEMGDGRRRIRPAL